MPFCIINPRRSGAALLTARQVTASAPTHALVHRSAQRPAVDTYIIENIKYEIKVESLELVGDIREFTAYLNTHERT